MLLVTADVENVLMEFHHNLPRRKESAVGGYCASCSLISAIKFSA
jgi:hypothetical protein